MALKILGKLVHCVISVWLLVALIGLVRGFDLPDAFWLVFLGVWVIAFVALETVWLWRKSKPFPHTLTHLRYAPSSPCSIIAREPASQLSKQRLRRPVPTDHQTSRAGRRPPGERVSREVSARGRSAGRRQPDTQFPEIGVEVETPSGSTQRFTEYSPLARQVEPGPLKK